MLNQSGITTVTGAAPVQILANVEMQAGFGCIVPESMGVTINSRKIVKAGTPIHIDLESLSTPAVEPVAAETNPASDAIPMNAVLLHDVDVTNGAANGTALVFGIINLNRLDAATQTLVDNAKGFGTPSALLTFVKA